MNKVEILFEEKAIDLFCAVVYSKMDTLDFIEQCRILKIRILGLDGFFITETTTRPSMADSVNYSSYPPDKNTYDNALEFVGSRTDNLFLK